MLEKTSVSMMVLLVAASLIGISSIHQYVEGQIAIEPLTETPSGSVVGTIVQVTSYASVAGCITVVQLSDKGPNPLGLQPGAPIWLFSERE